MRMRSLVLALVPLATLMLCGCGKVDNTPPPGVETEIPDLDINEGDLDITPGDTGSSDDGDKAAAGEAGKGSADGGE